MKLPGSIKSAVKKTGLFNYNVVARDQWVAEQAQIIPPGSSVLDAGAGSCPYRDLFSHCEYKTQDFSSLENKHLSGGAYGEIDYVCDIASIPVNDDSFDVILCSEVIEHVPEPEAVMSEFFRILKPGGKLLLTAPLGSGIHQEPYHYYGGFTPFWYEKVLSEKGFKNIRVHANGGSFKAFSQESIRFLQMTSPLSGIFPAWTALLWSPVWLVLFPFLAVIVPVVSHRLDAYDKKQHFTVGYFVTAEK